MSLNWVMLVHMKTGSFKGRKALVVDDSPTMRQSMVTILIGLEMDVVEVDSAHLALEILREGEIDFLFTDIVMPEMDGFELCEAIRKMPRLCSLPIIVVSTHRDEKYIGKALYLGADDFLPKPVDEALVIKVLVRLSTPVL